MKKWNNAGYDLLVILLAGAFFAYDNRYLNLFLNPEYPVKPQDDTVKIAAFNIQIFGETKREKTEVMNILVQIVREFDVVLIQEIRDASETTAPIFLEAINAVDGPEYDYIKSERLGSSASKERAHSNRHPHQDDAYNEIGNLTIVFDYVEGMGLERDIIALGDFNADGTYYDEDSLDNLLTDYGYF